MRYSEDHCRRVAEALVTTLSDKSMLQLQSERSQAVEKVVRALLDNFRQEEQLQRDAEQLAETHMQAGEVVDRHRVIQMITKRLAEERNFVL
jgi:hypothetical protein